MKFTWVKADGTGHKLITPDYFVKKLQEPLPPASIRKYREQALWRLSDDIPGVTDRISSIRFSSGYNQEEWLHYTGLILIEFNNLATPETAEKLKREIIGYKQPFLVFTGASSVSVKVVVRYTLPDGTLPLDKREALLFHEYAYRHACLHYKEQFNYPVTLKEPLLSQGCRISHDPQCFYNPEAFTVKMEMPAEWKRYQPESDGLPAASSKETTGGILPGYDQYKKMEYLFECCLDQTLAEAGKSWDEEDEKGFLVPLANYCLRSGIPEEDAVRWTYWHSRDKSSLDLIRITIRNVYRMEKMFGKKPCLPRPTEVVLRVEEFLNRRYEFRKNCINEQVEYRQKHTLCFRYKPLTPEVMNDIIREARREGIDTWHEDIEREIYSSSLHLFHPVIEYLESLPPWNGTDHIRELAGRVPTFHPYWKDLFYKWFVAMVAQWIKPGRKQGNSIVPVLTGGQGTRKSTFYRMLIPPELEDYYIENMSLDNRRNAELKMAQNVLIVLDEFDRINKKHQAELKNLIQLPRLKVKRPYQKKDDILPRLASFAANANPVDLLTDPTGSRRYLCVEVNGLIDTSGTLCYEQIYAQALQAVRQGEEYWLTPEEEKQIQIINQEFMNLPLEMQYVFSYFRVPEEGETCRGYYAVEIWDIIKFRSGQKFSVTSGKIFSRMLTGAGIHYSRIKGKNRYYLVEK